MDDLKEILDYDENTGIFRWKITKPGGRNIKEGFVAGTYDKKGYHRIKINRKVYLGHRLAWLFVKGNWPKKDIDHINGITNDNRICNLRECNKSENGQNRLRNKNNKSGFTGVSQKDNRWVAIITINKKTIYLGQFDTFEEAVEARKVGKEKYHAFNPKERI